MSELANIREARGLSQAELARRAGFQPSAISHFETGSRKPSYDNLLRLSEALEVSVDQIMGQQLTTGQTADLQTLLGELSFAELHMMRLFAESLIEGRETIKRLKEIN